MRTEYDLFISYLETYNSTKNAVDILTFLYGRRMPIPRKGEEYKYLPVQWLRQTQIDTYVPGIDPSIMIAPQYAITTPLILSEEQKTRCVRAKIPYLEREAALANETPE